MIEPAILNWRAWLPGTMKRGVLMLGCESAIEQGPRAFDAVGVDITPQPFFGGVVDALMQRILIAAAFVSRDAAFQGRYAQETLAELLTFVPLRGAFPTIRKTLSHWVHQVLPPMLGLGLVVAVGGCVLKDHGYSHSRPSAAPQASSEFIAELKRLSHLKGDVVAAAQLAVRGIHEHLWLQTATDRQEIADILGQITPERLAYIEDPDPDAAHGDPVLTLHIHPTIGTYLHLFPGHNLLQSDMLAALLVYEAAKNTEKARARSAEAHHLHGLLEHAMIYLEANLEDFKGLVALYHENELEAVNRELSVLGSVADLQGRSLSKKWLTDHSKKAKSVHRMRDQFLAYAWVFENGKLDDNRLRLAALKGAANPIILHQLMNFFVNATPRAALDGADKQVKNAREEVSAGIGSHLSVLVLKDSAFQKWFLTWIKGAKLGASAGESPSIGGTGSAPFSNQTGAGSPLRPPDHRFSTSA